MKKGKEYEILIEQLYRRLEPNADIIQDDHILGRDTNTLRQIDVSIRYRFAGHSNLIIIQAKDYKNPADINKVGEFLSVIRDVNANKGILICSSGFTKKAIEYGKNKGIELLTIHSAQNKKWEKLLKIHVEKTVHHFYMDDHLLIDIGDKTGKEINFTYNTYSYDKLNIIGLVDIIQDNIILKNSWKDIKRGKTITFYSQPNKIFHLIDHDMMNVDGYISIQYEKSVTTNFYIDPTNYNYEINHTSNEEKLHDLTITIDDIDKVGNNEFPNDTEIEDSPHLKVTVFQYNNDQYLMTYKFMVRGFILGDFYSKDNKFMKKDDRSNLIVGLENMLKSKDS